MTSSEISTDVRLPSRPRRGGGAPSPEPAGEAGFRPWHFFVLGSLVAATAAVMMSSHPHPANLMLVSLTVGAAGMAGYGLYRTLAPLALPEDRQTGESLGARARAAIEREKMLVLRSIKELEFDRAMGKVSEPDFEEMAARLRARAVALMKQIDQTDAGYRELIEQELRTRLGRGPKAPALAPAERASVAAEPAAAAPALARQSAEREGGVCAGCGTINEEDARFCKQCGHSITPA